MEDGKCKMPACRTGWEDGHWLTHIFLLIIALLILSGSILKAQDVADKADKVEITSLTKIRLTIFGVGLEREQKIGPLKSIYGGVSISSVYLFEPQYSRGRAPDVLNIEGSLGIAPVLYTGFRKYYTLAERKKNNKKIINNSGGYLGFHISATAPIKQGGYKTLLTINFAPHAGFQRSIGRKTNFEFAFGPAIKTNFETAKLVPFSKIGLSFLL